MCSCTSSYIYMGVWVYLLLFRDRYENASVFLYMKKWIKIANLGLSSDVKYIPISGWPRFRFSIRSLWMLTFLLPAWIRSAKFWWSGLVVLSVFTVVFPFDSQWPADALSDALKGHTLGLLSSGDLVSSDCSLWSGCSSNTKTIP